MLSPSVTSVTSNIFFKHMKANYILPIASVQGKIAHGYYARILHGKTIIQRCPVRTKPATAAQRKAQHDFVARFANPKDHSPPY